MRNSAMVKTYRVNEIFYSLQGEGAYTGVPMVFVRFAGCNMRCPFCDTQHEPYTMMTAQEIRAQIMAFGCNTVCLTGGEPTLQVTEELIAEAFDGFRVHMETNGSNTIPQGVDWAVVSPKGRVMVTQCQELKLLYGKDMDSPERWEHFDAQVLSLQPMEVEGDAEATRQNVISAIEYCKKHPRWRLSLQTHKMINIK